MDFKLQKWFIQNELKPQESSACYISIFCMVKKTQQCEIFQRLLTWDIKGFILKMLSNMLWDMSHKMSLHPWNETVKYGIMFRKWNRTQQ